MQLQVAAQGERRSHPQIISVQWLIQNFWVGEDNDSRSEDRANHDFPIVNKFSLDRFPHR